MSEAAQKQESAPQPAPPPAPDGFASWAVLELFGHRVLAGYVTEALVAGVAFIRIDVPSREGGTRVSQFYNPKSVYSLTPTTEEAARAAAARQEPSAAHVLQLGPYDDGEDADLHDDDDEEF